MRSGLIIGLVASVLGLLSGQPNQPYLRNQGTATQLIVEGKPFLVLGGELGNSSATDMNYLQPIWPTLKSMNLNTVLVPVFWELIEPTEGIFDFSLLDSTISEARKQDLKLILLWFGSWKNSMSSHAPAWIKKNQERFPRAKDDKGCSQEILTPFSENNLKADVQAFEKLMQHLKVFDQKQQTVLMVQVENEVGMLPSARDYCPLANEKFGQNVPTELINYLQKNRAKLVPEFLKIWEQNGFKSNGAWEEIFGKGTHTDELFMAWYFSKFTNAVAAAGKKIYPLPMFVNAALNRTGREPGNYPSAGPLPHLMDIWKAAGTAIDFFSPDFYNPDFKHWNDLYTRQDNPLFIPEHRFDKTVGAKAAYAIGHYGGLGFAPFSIESTEEPLNEPLGKMYGLLAQMSPLIAQQQGKGTMDAVLFDKDDTEKVLTMGDFVLTCRHDYTLGWSPNAKNETWESGGAVIVQTDDSEYFVAGTGVVITLQPLDRNKIAGILSDEEGQFSEGKWTPGRKLNGDQTHQGRHVRLPMGEYAIQRFELYIYE
ncbi:MAG: mannonate dehydratase [Bacteroidetes bacterium]|nr:mannonate dehydratase [Bacteroidota bacterium]